MSQIQSKWIFILNGIWYCQPQLIFETCLQNGITIIFTVGEIMKIINKLSIVLVVCGFLMLGWHTTVLSQQSGSKAVTDSKGSSFPVPEMLGRIEVGDGFHIGLSTSYSGTVTFVKMDEPDIGATASSNFSGLKSTILFDDLGLPPGRYDITESFSTTLSGSSLFIPFPSLDLGAGFDTWGANLSAGATITVNASVTVTSASVSGDFSGPLGLRLPAPPPSSLTVRATVTKEKGETISYSVSFTATVHKETSLTTKELPHPPEFTEPAAEATYDAGTFDEGTTVMFNVAAINPNLPARGEVTIGASGDPVALGAALTDGVFSWLIPGNTVTADEDTKTLTVTFTATLVVDGLELTSTLTAAITVNNDEDIPPQIIITPAEIPPVKEGEMVQFTVVVNHHRAFTLTDSGVPSGASFNSTDTNIWEFSWTPGDVVPIPDLTANFTVTVTATDDTAATLFTTKDVTITVINVEPIALTVTGETSLEEGQTVTLQLSTDDPLGQTPTYSMNSIPGATLDPDTGIFEW